MFPSELFSVKRAIRFSFKELCPTKLPLLKQSHSDLCWNDGLYLSHVQGIRSKTAVKSCFASWWSRTTILYLLCNLDEDCDYSHTIALLPWVARISRLAAFETFERLYTLRLLWDRAKTLFNTHDCNCFYISFTSIKWLLWSSGVHMIVAVDSATLMFHF